MLIHEQNSNADIPVRFFCLMQHHVPPHVFHEREALATDLALVWLLARVSQHVVLEILPFRRLKRALGMRTAERVSRVDEPMCLQLTLVRRRVPTDVTQMVLLVAVCDHVVLQRMLPLEAHRAHLTYKRFLFRVLRQMQVQLRPRPETCVARRTEEWHWSFVLDNVSVQHLAAVKVLVAVVAGVQRKFVQLFVVCHFPYAVRSEVT